MAKYLAKWAMAGLIWPVLYLSTYSFVTWSEEAVLVFWPTSIVLMSLGDGPNETWYVVYVWLVGTCLNTLTYLCIGLLVKLVIVLKQRTDHKNS